MVNGNLNIKVFCKIFVQYVWKVVCRQRFPKDEVSKEVYMQVERTPVALGINRARIPLASAGG